MRILLAILFLPLLAWADDAFPVARRSGLPGNLWTSAGIAGGIPYATTIFTNLPTGTTLAQLNAWIAACPSNQVVKLAAGVFDLGGIVNLTKNGVVLRGTTNANGVPATFLTNVQIAFNSYPICGPSGFTNGISPSVSTNDVLSGYSEGSTAITLSNSPDANFAVGNLFVLDQNYDGALVFNDRQSEWRIRYQRPYAQALFVTNIVGNVIHFMPPLCGYYWSNSQAPQAYAWASHQNTRRRTGLEDVDIVRNAVGDLHAVVMHDTYESWARNVRVKLESYSAIDLSWGVHSEVRHCTVHDSTCVGATYPIPMVLATSCRVEDNCFTNSSTSVVLTACVGCSVSYNVGLPPYPCLSESNPDWMWEYMFTHGGHCHHNLFEGNWLDGPLEFDDVFEKNSSDNGIVRCRLRGWATGFADNCAGFIVGEPPGSDYPDSDQRNVTAIGNILGTDGFHTGTTYYYVKPACTGTIRTNNYNTVDDGIPTGEAIGANTMRDSYTYNARPAWFGNLAWPPFSPTDFAGCTISNIPAGYRATFGSDPPSAQTNRPLALRVVGQATIRSATIR